MLQFLSAIRLNSVNSILTVSCLFFYSIHIQQDLRWTLPTGWTQSGKRPWSFLQGTVDYHFGLEVVGRPKCLSSWRTSTNDSRSEKYETRWDSKRTESKGSKGKGQRQEIETAISCPALHKLIVKLINLWSNLLLPYEYRNPPRPNQFWWIIIIKYIIF